MNAIEVEVAYATPQRQVVVKLSLPEGSTVQTALSTSGIVERFPELIKDGLQVGIFAQTCGLEKVLRSGDRVEIYRPLRHDPKDARRQRAQKK